VHTAQQGIESQRTARWATMMNRKSTSCIEDVRLGAKQWLAACMGSFEVRADSVFHVLASRFHCVVTTSCS